MDLYTRYSFYPVGQGIFSSGELGTIGGQEFRWVYDCGSVKKSQSLLVEEIERFESLFPRAANRAKPKLDLTFISHFDVDHISGLVELLSRFDVDTLVIPYVPLWQRVVSTITSPQAHNQRFQHFMMNPVSFIGSLDGARVRRIVLVPPSNGSPPDDSAETLRDLPIPDGGLPSLELDRPSAPTEEQASLSTGRGRNMTVSYLAPGGRLLLGNVWEFAMFNEPKLNIKATAHFKLAARRLSNGLLQAASPSLRDQVLKRLKRMYERIFGSTATKKNEISLFVYSGPVGRYQLQRKGATNVIARASNGPWRCIGYCDLCANSMPTYADDASNILYTGDGYLSTKHRIKKLREYLGERRLEKLSVFQVMHHGSLKNWRKGVADEFKPGTSIFCADPTIYGHPNEAVQRDFKPYGATVVNSTGVSRFYELRLL